MKLYAFILALALILVAYLSSERKRKSYLGRAKGDSSQL